MAKSILIFLYLVVTSNSLLMTEAKEEPKEDQRQDNQPPPRRNQDPEVVEVRVIEKYQPHNGKPMIFEKTKVVNYKKNGILENLGKTIANLENYGLTDLKSLIEQPLNSSQQNKTIPVNNVETARIENPKIKFITTINKTSTEFQATSTEDTTKNYKTTQLDGKDIDHFNINHYFFGSDEHLFQNKERDLVSIYKYKFKNFKDFEKLMKNSENKMNKMSHLDTNKGIVYNIMNENMINIPNGLYGLLNGTRVKVPGNIMIKNQLTFNNGKNDDLSKTETEPTEKNDISKTDIPEEISGSKKWIKNEKAIKKNDTKTMTSETERPPIMISPKPVTTNINKNFKISVNISTEFPSGTTRNVTSRLLFTTKARNDTEYDSLITNTTEESTTIKAERVIISNTTKKSYTMKPKRDINTHITEKSTTMRLKRVINDHKITTPVADRKVAKSKNKTKGSTKTVYFKKSITKMTSPSKTRKGKQFSYTTSEYDGPDDKAIRVPSESIEQDNKANRVPSESIEQDNKANIVPDTTSESDEQDNKASPLETSKRRKHFSNTNSESDDQDNILVPSEQEDPDSYYKR